MTGDFHEKKEWEKGEVYDFKELNVNRHFNLIWWNCFFLLFTCYLHQYWVFVATPTDKLLLPDDTASINYPTRIYNHRKNLFNELEKENSFDSEYTWIKICDIHGWKGKNFQIEFLFVGKCWKKKLKKHI